MSSCAGAVRGMKGITNQEIEGEVAACSSVRSQSEIVELGQLQLGQPPAACKYRN